MSMYSPDELERPQGACQNDPIYSDDPAEEELMIEWHSRFDYIAELTAEFADCGDEYELEDEEAPEPFLRSTGWWSDRVCACRAETFTRRTWPAFDGDPCPF